MTLIQRVNALSTTIGNFLKNSVLPKLLPAGGTTGQVLSKASGTDYETTWLDNNVNFGFEQVESLPIINLFHGRIVEFGVNGLQKYDSTTSDWVPVISNLGLDEGSGSPFIGANEFQIAQTYEALVWMLQNFDATSSKLTELDISSGSGSFSVTAENSSTYIANVDRLRPRIIKNTSTARAVAVGNPNNAIVNTTIPLSTGDILLPRYIASNNSWAYEVIPAPVVDTDYVSIFNAALV